MIAAADRQPAVLIVNPTAGASPEARRDDVIAALRRRFALEAYSTDARDAGIALASDAAAQGVPLVIAFGGDGHVNEVANGLVGTGTALGIIPGGTMNVFARALGVPLHPLNAVRHLLSRSSDAERTVPLGKMDDRYFTFSAGCGFDAEAAARVEHDLRSKRRFGELFFFWSAFRVLAGTYRHRQPSMTLRGGFGEVPVSMAVACNAGPYAYLAGRAISLAPRVRLEAGLDVFALKTMRIEALPLYAWRCVVSGDLTEHEDAFYAHDLDGFEIAAAAPFARHVDGEPLPPSASARFTIERDALRVRA